MELRQQYMERGKGGGLDLPFYHDTKLPITKF